MEKMQSIKIKLIISFSILLIIILAAIGFLTIQNSRKVVKYEAEETLMILAEEAARFTDSEINSVKKVLLSIAQRDDIESMNWDIQKNVLKTEIKNTNFIKMGVVQTNGTSYFTDGNISNLWGKKYIKDALNGETTISELLYSNTNDEISLVFAAPIINKKKIVGALIGYRDGYFLSEITDNIKYKTEGYGYIIDEDGTNIAHPDRSFVKNQYNPLKEAKNDKSLETVVKSFDNVLNKEKGITDYFFQGSDYYVAYDSIPETEWKLVVSATTDEVLESIPPMRNSIIIYAVIALIIGVIMIYIIGAKIAQPIGLAANHLQKIANLDISQDVPEHFLKQKGEIGVLARSVDDITRNLGDIIKEISDSSEQVASTSEELTASSEQTAAASDEIAKTVEDIAEGAMDQATNTQEGTTMAMSLGKAVEKNKSHMKNLNTVFAEVTKVVDQGLIEIEELDKITKESDTAIKDIYEVILKTDDSSSKIGEASEVIGSIAEQTNLLALNAAIEAARAGEAGKGFAVVAEEVRELSEKSSTYTMDINEIVNELQKNVEDAVNTMKRVIEITDEQTNSVSNNKSKYLLIDETMEESKKAMKNLTDSEKEVEKMKNEILEILENLSAVAEENSAATEEVTATMEEQYSSTKEVANASESLSQLAQDLKTIVEKIKIK